MAEIGLKFWDGSNIVEIPVLADLTSQPLRIAKNGTIYAISLVEVSSPDALSIRIKTPAGIKALGYTVPVIIPTVKINSISFYIDDIYRNWDTVTATITIIDAVTLLPLPDVTIEAIWSGAYNATVTGESNGSGIVSFITPWIISGLVTITINKVWINDVEQPFTGEITKSIYVN